MISNATLPKSVFKKYPFAVLDVEKSDTAPLVAHFGYLSHDVMEGLRGLHTGRRKVLLDEAHVRCAKRAHRPTGNRKKKTKGSITEIRYPIARTSHNRSRRTDLRRATPEVEVTYQRLSSSWDGTRQFLGWSPLKRHTLLHTRCGLKHTPCTSAKPTS